MHSKAPFTRYNLLSNRLSNRFDNRVNVCIHDTTGCQTGCQTRLTTGLTTGCIVYTNIQPVVKPCLSNRLYNPVWQPVVSCKRGLSNVRGRCFYCRWRHRKQLPRCTSHYVNFEGVLWIHCRPMITRSSAHVGHRQHYYSRPRIAPAIAEDCSILVVLFLWSPYVIGQTIIFLPCDFYLLSSFFFSFLAYLSCREMDVYHTSTHGMALVRI